MTVRRVLAVAGTALVLVLVALGAMRGILLLRIRTALQDLVSAAERQDTHVARLSVASHAPRVTRSAISEGTSQSELRLAVSRVLTLTQDMNSTPARRASAWALYYQGDYSSAAQDLEKIARDTNDAALWSDLAAARLEGAKAADAPVDLVAALVAADRALQIAPDSAAALFNRASIIDVMGLRPHAKAAWQKCLSVESDPGYQSRIRVRLADAEMPSDVESWEKAKWRLIGVDPSLDSRIVRETIDPFRQEARKDAEGVLPAQWADAILAGRRNEADATLRLARAIAAAFRELSGDPFAADCIAVIDAAVASHDDQRVATLAGVYVAYRTARIALKDGQVAAAEAGLRKAADAFAAAGSPMAFAARYYMATALSEQNRLIDAAAELSSLRRDLLQRRPRDRTRIGDIDWTVAHNEGVRGHWDTSVAAATEGAATARAVGDKRVEGAMENMLAELYDALGQPQRAWKHRVAAFTLMSAAGDLTQLQVSLGASSRVSFRQGNYDAAIALIDLEAGFHQRADLLADAMVRLARAHAGKTDLMSARQDLGRARAALQKIPDTNLRASVEADIDAAEGVIERDADPRSSERLLSKAIQFHMDASRKLPLPELLLERGRSRLVVRDENGALADFDAGIEELELQRATVGEFETSSTLSDSGEGLFVEAARILAKRGDAQRTFAYSEQSRGRALLQRLAPVPASDPLATLQRLPAGVMVVEYMVTPEEVLAFAADGRGVRMVRIAIASKQLEERVDAWTSAIRNGSADTARDQGGTLYRLLLEPLHETLDGASKVVFIANKCLERVPWAALYDSERSRYLAEDALVTTAPGVVFLTSQASFPGEKSLRTALVIGNPRKSADFIDLPVLAAAEAEARGIAALYPESVLLIDHEPTRKRFIEEAPHFDIIHFAGHAISSDVREDQSFLVLADVADDDSGLLYSRDIASLRLHTRLVVLAACGTLRGTTVHLDGMPSIARSFLAAGAQNVVGTLWDIDDQRSALLYQQFHRAVARGVPVAEALHEAQMRAIHSSDQEVAHPRTWAGITLFGGL